MGLDSVELLMSFEDYFSISVSDAEAANISTVQQIVDCAAHHLNISSNDTTLKSHLYEKIKSFFKNNHISGNSLLLTDKIFDFLNPDDKMLWTELSKNLELKVPFPYIENNTGIIKKVLSFVTWTPDYDWKNITVDEFITAIAASNYELLIKPKEIKSKYEILVAIIALTTEKTGVDIYEVQPHKNFVNDFGID